MKRIIYILQFVVAAWTYPIYNPFEYFYPLALPYGGYSEQNFGQNYALQSPSYTEEFIHNPITEYSSPPIFEPTLNILAELPFAISNKFSVVPMYIVSKSAMNMVSQGNIVSASDHDPIITVKLDANHSIQCTPAVRMVLEKPIIVGTLKSSILFPSEVQIIHEGVRVPIKIGAVIVPVLPNTYVSQETPIAVRVVYAVPTKPIKITITIHQDHDPPQQPNLEPPNQISQSQTNPNDNKENQQSVNDYTDNGQALQNGVSTSDSPINNAPSALTNSSDYINNADAVFISNQEAIVIESETELPPKNITIIQFPEQEAEPQLQVDEEDDELVNRNPPLVLAPAGIVQSTQPETHDGLFHNDKESPYLETFREQSKRKRI